MSFTNVRRKIRKYLREIAIDILSLGAKPSVGIHILNGHMITSSPGHGSSFDRLRFEELLNYLHKSCDFINIEDAIKLIERKESVNRPTIAFTFDDGLEDCYYSIAPVLEKFGVNAMFFINPNAANAATEKNENYISDFVNQTILSPGKRPMDWKQIRELQDRGFLFGAHTLDHYMINDLNSDTLRQQIIGCRKPIEEQLDISCDCFAWPYGSLKHVNDLSIDIAVKEYKYVFSQCDYKKYYSFNGQVINRRHFEAWWPKNHVSYFLSHKKQF